MSLTAIPSARLAIGTSRAAARHTAGRLISIDSQGHVTPVVGQYGATRFNSPNDLWIDPSGGRKIVHMLTRSCSDGLACLAVQGNRAIPHGWEPLLAGEENRFLRLAPGGDASKFLWNPQELCVLKELQTPLTFEKLRAATGLHEAILKRILGVLERLGIVQMSAPEPEAAEQTQALATRMDFALDILIPRVTNAVLHEKIQVAKNDYSFASEQFKNLAATQLDGGIDDSTTSVVVDSAMGFTGGTFRIRIESALPNSPEAQRWQVGKTTVPSSEPKRV